MPYIVEVKNVYKRYNRTEALKDVSMNIKKGEIYGFVGENGAGKSTMIRIITNINRPTMGSVKLNTEERLGAVAVLAVAILRFLGKGIMKSDAFIVLALAVLALLFVVLSKQFVVMTNQDVKDAFIKDYALTGGAIAVAVLAGLGGVSAVLADYIK